MAVPIDKKDQAVYHTILSEMHRLHGAMLNMQTLDEATTEAALRQHFGREQNVTLGKLMEWKGRRPQIYSEAQRDFADQVRKPLEG